MFSYYIEKFNKFQSSLKKPVYKYWVFWMALFLIFGTMGNIMVSPAERAKRQLLIRQQYEELKAQKAAEGAKAEEEKRENALVLEKLETKVDVQDMFNNKGKRKVVTFVKNNSDKPVSFSVSIFSYDVDGLYLDGDLMLTQTVEPEKTVTATSWLKVGTYPKVDLNINLK